jgi:hypothetical protein
MDETLQATFELCQPSLFAADGTSTPMPPAAFARRTGSVRITHQRIGVGEAPLEQGL